MVFLLLHVVLLAGGAAAPPAVSFGDGRCGKIDGGVALPCRGKNFEPFSDATCLQGRNIIHPLLRQTVLQAYSAMRESTPERKWQYGDMGKLGGGRLEPHNTHQNGLSVDFYMPLLDPQGAPVKMPNALNQKYAGKLDFDAQGRLGELTIDFKAVAAHLLALQDAGKTRGVGIERVIVTPDFHAALVAAHPRMSELLPLFYKKEAGRRHDEHYHVDFRVPERFHRPWVCTERDKRQGR
jgi:penicillin-insensitive murein DD-endopeptidase